MSGISNPNTASSINATLQGGDIEIGAVEIKDGVTDARAEVTTASADGSNNAANSLRVSARMKGYNGSTWDLLRSGLTAASAAVTGFLNSLPWALYHSTPATRNDGQGGPLEADSSGNLKATLGTTIAGEDIPNDRMKTVQGPFSYLHIAAGQATTTVKTGAGVLHAIIFNGAATATNVTTIYDNTAASGTVIGIPAATAVTTPESVIYDVSFTVGLTINTATANGSDMTVAYS